MYRHMLHATVGATPVPWDRRTGDGGQVGGEANALAASALVAAR